MDQAVIMLLGMVALPTLPALLNGSFSGVILAALLGFAAAATVAFSPLGWGLWLLAWIVAWLIGSGQEKRRRSERQHKELLDAIAKGQKVEPPPR